MAQKKSIAGLSEMYIQARPQILSLLSNEIPAVFNHIAATKQKMIQKFSMYLATFMDGLGVVWEEVNNKYKLIHFRHIDRGTAEKRKTKTPVF
jgi:hypothetical protein